MLIKTSISLIEAR